jgi:hypothetical protein
MEVENERKDKMVLGTYARVKDFEIHTDRPEYFGFLMPVYFRNNYDTV